LFVAICVLVSSSQAESAEAKAGLVIDTGAHALLGPIQAAGAIIWSHGRSLTREDSTAATPSYIDALRQQRWDAFRFNRLRAVDDLAKSPAGLAKAAHQLKQQGYKRVVLAGQSFGAIISLVAADRSDDVDAVIATAPAAYPPWGAWRQFNALKLYSTLDQIRRARVMLFFFRGDEFDPGGRAPHSESILDERDLPHLIIDRPAGLATHWAAGTDRFAAGFGDCITAFASDDTARGSLSCATLQDKQVAGQASGRTARHGVGTAKARDAGRAPLLGSTLPDGHRAQP
jgi:dienelactone hydrolase